MVPFCLPTLCLMHFIFVLLIKQIIVAGMADAFLHSVPEKHDPVFQCRCCCNLSTFTSFSILLKKIATHGRHLAFCQGNSRFAVSYDISCCVDLLVGDAMKSSGFQLVDCFYDSYIEYSNKLLFIID